VDVTPRRLLSVPTHAGAALLLVWPFHVLRVVLRERRVTFGAAAAARLPHDSAERLTVARYLRPVQDPAPVPVRHRGYGS